MHHIHTYGDWDFPLRCFRIEAGNCCALQHTLLCIGSCTTVHSFVHNRAFMRAQPCISACTTVCKGETGIRIAKARTMP